MWGKQLEELGKPMGKHLQLWGKEYKTIGKTGNNWENIYNSERDEQFVTETQLSPRPNQHLGPYPGAPLEGFTRAFSLATDFPSTMTPVSWS